MPIAETGAVSPPCEACGRSFLADGWKRCRTCRKPPKGGGQTMGRLNGAFTGSGGDLRLNDGEVPLSQLGGACRRCGRSFVKREDSDGLCRDCSLVVGRKVASGSPAPRPESAGGGGSVEASLPTCSVEDCLRAPSAFGMCRTHLEEERAARPRPAPQAIEPPPIAEGLELVKVEIVEEEKPVAPEKKTCALESCGAEFVPDRITQRFHSQECKVAFHHAKARPVAKKAPARKKPEQLAADAGQAAAERASRPTPSIRAPRVVHRDVKPENVIAGSERFSPDDVRVLLELGQLEPEARARIARWAYAEWGALS